MLNVLVPDIPSVESLLPYFRRIDSSKWYTNHGGLVLELEKRLENIYHKHVITTSSATLGLELAVMSYGIGRGRKVLVPSLSFPATASIAVRCGLEPVYSDVDPESWQITPEIALDALGQSSFDLVLPVSAFGAEHDVKGWDDFQKLTGVKVVIDAAAAFGNPWLGDGEVMKVVSTHATKSLGSAEGGFVIIQDFYRSTFIRRLSNFGIDPSQMDGAAMWCGTNAKMSEYHAAIALCGLDFWSEKSSKRIELHKYYCQRIGAVVPSVALQKRNVEAVYNTFVVLLPAGVNAPSIAARLRNDGIQTRRWYCPPQHEHPGLRYKSVGGLPVTEKLSGRLLGLPFHVFMTKEDVDRVVSKLLGAIQ